MASLAKDDVDYDKLPVITADRIRVGLQGYRKIQELIPFPEGTEFKLMNDDGTSASYTYNGSLARQSSDTIRASDGLELFVKSGLAEKLGITVMTDLNGSKSKTSPLSGSKLNKDHPLATKFLEKHGKRWVWSFPFVAHAKQHGGTFDLRFTANNQWVYLVNTKLVPVTKDKLFSDSTFTLQEAEVKKEEDEFTPSDEDNNDEDGGDEAVAKTPDSTPKRKGRPRKKTADFSREELLKLLAETTPSDEDNNDEDGGDEAVANAPDSTPKRKGKGRPRKKTTKETKEV
jgi:hypothetical protein